MIPWNILEPPHILEQLVKTTAVDPPVSKPGPCNCSCFRCEQGHHCGALTDGCDYYSCRKGQRRLADATSRPFGIEVVLSAPSLARV